MNSKGNFLKYIMVDIESDGPIPGDFSMISFGAVVVDKQLNKSFYGQLKPISENFVPEMLAISGHSREETMTFADPKQVMDNFAKWIIENCKDCKPGFISDNNGFDWMFICWYFHHFTGSNPFGFSSQNLGSLYKGVRRNMFSSFRYLSETEHTHNPVDDATGDAEALLKIIKFYKVENFHL
jgi:hypothetical protein